MSCGAHKGALSIRLLVVQPQIIVSEYHITIAARHSQALSFTAARRGKRYAASDPLGL